jgi:hypothetical protein
MAPDQPVMAAQIHGIQTCDQLFGIQNIGMYMVVKITLITRYVRIIRGASFGSLPFSSKKMAIRCSLYSVLIERLLKRCSTYPFHLLIESTLFEILWHIGCPL